MSSTDPRTVAVTPQLPQGREAAANASSTPAKRRRVKKAGRTVNHLPPDTLYRLCSGPGAGENGQILPLLAHALQAEATLLIEFETAGQLTVMERHAHGSQTVYSTVGPEFERLATQTAESRKPIWRSVRTASEQLLLVVVPVQTRETRVVSLGVALKSVSTREAPDIALAVQGYGALAVTAQIAIEHKKEAEAFDRVSAAFELLRLCSTADDYPEATGLMADHLCEVTGCSRVFVVGKKRTQPRLIAASGGQDTEQRSEGTLALEEAVADCLRQKRSLVRDPNVVGGNQNVIGPAKQILSRFSSTGYIISPLTLGDKQVGGWVFLWDRVDEHFDEKARFVQAIGEQFGPFLHLLKQGRPDGYKATVARLWKRAGASQKNFLTVLGIIAVGALLFPAKTKIAATTQVEPVVRRVIAAPFDATLRRTFVEAGDVVEESALLAELDGREIRAQLAEASANYSRASKEADRARDAGKIAESQMASLEAEAFLQQKQIAEEREVNLEIRSSIAGLVIQGDLERAEGAPLQQGDRLFEIAPIDELRIEIEIEEGQIARIREGMPVKLKFQAHPDETFEAEILTIPPRSEIRANANVFVCEARLSNEDGLLRPGMKGKAKVVGNREIFIVSLMRPLVNAVRLKLWL